MTRPFTICMKIHTVALCLFQFQCPFPGKLSFGKRHPSECEKEVYSIPARMAIKSYSLECQIDFHANIRRESLKRIRDKIHFNVTCHLSLYTFWIQIKSTLMNICFKFDELEEFFHERWKVLFDRYCILDRPHALTEIIALKVMNVVKRFQIFQFWIYRILILQYFRELNGSKCIKQITECSAYFTKPSMGQCVFHTVDR